MDKGKDIKMYIKRSWSYDIPKRNKFITPFRKFRESLLSYRSSQFYKSRMQQEVMNHE